MTKAPKIVYDRLRAASADQAAVETHLEANLLTAFAEQTLLSTERDRVLEHLAHCSDCRDVLALALPAAEIVTHPVAAATKAGWAISTVGVTKTKKDGPASDNAVWLDRIWQKLSWPNLRWAALAAGIAMVAVLAVNPGKLLQSPHATTVGPSAASASRAAGAEIASSTIQSPPIQLSPVQSSQVRSSPGTSSRTGEKSISAKPAEAQPKSQVQLSDSLKTRQKAEQLPMHQAQSEMMLAKNQDNTATTDDKSLIAQNEAPPIEKAKPALPEAATQGAGDNAQLAAASTGTVQPGNMASAMKLDSAAPRIASQPNVMWTIAAGVLQRSLDSGQNWQSSLHANHPLLCYAPRGEEIWVGGEAGTLFHSSNNGLTWVQVQPSIVQSQRAQRLTSDISYIDLRSALEIILVTKNNTTWRSVDGGKTWEEK
jgi:hypothetical protein